MARSNFENLRVYLLAEELADKIWRIVKEWGHFERDTLGKQIVTSADSVGANVAEGAGRFGFNDNKRFVYIARGSLNETRHWLRCAYRRGLIPDGDVGDLKRILDELSPSLNAYINSIDAQRNLRRAATNNEPRTTN